MFVYTFCLLGIVHKHHEYSYSTICKHIEPTPQHTNFLSPILRLLLSLLKTSLFSSLLSFFSKTRQNAFRPKLGNIKDWFMLTSIIPLQKQIVTHVSYRYFNSIQSRVGTYVSGDNYHLLHQNFKTVHFRCQP